MSLRRRHASTIVALVAVSTPILIALAARRTPVWVPDLDLALTELRLRDVGSRYSPLVGLPGRIGTLDRQGSHPGPLAFYLLAPVYRLLGSTSFALHAATALFHLAGAATAVLLVARQAGTRWALAVGGCLTLLVASLGPNLFTEPWNPHLPVLWWPAFLVTAWCILEGEVRALPVLVVAGAVCAQSHLSYVPAVGVVTVVTLAVSARHLGTTPIVHWRRWLAGAAVMMAIVWAPPVIDQVTREPGNLGLLVEHFGDPPEAPIGVDGVRLALERLDVLHLAGAATLDPGDLATSYPSGASAARGFALVLAFATVGWRSWPAAPRPLRSLHGLTAMCLVLAAISTTRILGFPWSYLMLWIWVVSLLAVMAIVAGLATKVGATARASAPAARPGAFRLVPAVAIAALAAWASVAAADAAPTNPVVSRSVLAAVDRVVDGVDGEGRYVVTWDDSVHLGGHGYGMVVELERRGVDVTVPAGLAVQFGRHRVGEDGLVDGQIVVASGRAIARWTAVDGARPLVELDARTDLELAEARRLRATLDRELRRAGLGELVGVVDENLLAVAFDRRLPAALRPLVRRFDELGAPLAVFLAPPGPVSP